jgi:hypothetical protein
MTENYIPVEDKPYLARDDSTGAIINRNRSAYDKAKKRAAESQKQRDEIRDTTREINNLKCEMHEIKHLLKQLVGKE